MRNSFNYTTSTVVLSFSLAFKFLGPISSTCSMGDPGPSPSSRLQVLFESALQDYEKQTGTKLTEHPLARQLETCDSVESVTAVIQGQGRDFGEFKGSEGKVSKSLQRAVSVLYPLSTSAVLGNATSLVRLVVLMISAASLTFVFSVAVLTWTSTICWSGHLTRSMSPLRLKSPYLCCN